MFEDIRREIDNQKMRNPLVENHTTTSLLQNHDTISGATSSNIANEVIDLVEDSNQMDGNMVKLDPDAGYVENLSKAEICGDNSVLDISQVDTHPVECKKSNYKGKIYSIENMCVICKKTFSCQREFGKHAQTDHPNEKAFKCLHCPALFSKFKSVTAHFNRRHVHLDKSRSIYSNSQRFFTTDVNQKGKNYPIENKCAVCEKKFSFQKELVKHAKHAHPHGKVFKCLYCPTIFSKLKSVPVHYKRGHSNLRKSFFCEYCNMSFYTYFLLDRHTRSHTEHRPFSCKQCGKTYKYKRNLLVHIKTHSNNYEFSNTNYDGHYKDELCDNDEQSLYENYEQNLLTGDEYSGTNEQTLSSENDDEEIITSEIVSADGNSNNATNQQYLFKCNECHKAFKYKKNFKYHQKNHRTNNEATETIILDDTMAYDQNINFYNSTYFIIDELNTDTEQFENFGEESFNTANHSEEYGYEDFAPGNTQTTADLSQNECGICMKVFKCQQAVGKHLSRCHPEIEFYKCPYCDDNFYSLDALSMHITEKKHHQKRNICEMCLKSFNRRGDLKRHAKIHSDERPYSCNVCSKAFKQTNHLRRHQEISHENVKETGKFDCQICQKIFLTEESLKRHVRSHDKKTQYPCSMCSKSFKTRYEWQRHQATHSSRKYLICEFCLRSFNDVQTFDLHLMEHTGERKYLCTICDKSYREKSHLISHRKTHTKC